MRKDRKVKEKEGKGEEKERKEKENKIGKHPSSLRIQL
jgi:hypothetical protein